ncbi:hypothetical protein JKP88DRAFT_261927 [Tribonema minus]|uniref:Uncharacterized protein n=1 Tax=Tribonema minus TaxID=303371 RepID=A0A836CLT4_9STRA|nr:hypothetical protein JKP88DRAFT_261927 [Tribonema minus]
MSDSGWVTRTSPSKVQQHNAPSQHQEHACCNHHADSQMQPVSAAATVPPPQAGPEPLPEDDDPFLEREGPVAPPAAAAAVNSSPTAGPRMVEGRGIWCLLPHSAWFQGHFVFRGGGCGTSDKAIGLLATQLDMDPCMMCCYQGFGRYDLALINRKTSKQTSVVVEKSGDHCMALRTETAGDPTPDEARRAIAFHAEDVKVASTKKELMQRFFPSILAAIADSGDDVLDDCSLCLGPMSVSSHLLLKVGAL